MAVFAQLGWKMFPNIGRVYVNDKARRDLGWTPRYDFARLVEARANGRPTASPLAMAIGVKGYHDQSFDEGPYPV